MGIRGLAATGILLASGIAPAASRDERPASGSAAAVPSLRTIGDLPATFESNRGQIDPAVRFLARFRGGRAYITDTEAVLEFPRGTGAVPRPKSPDRPRSPGSDVVRVRVEGARPGEPVGMDPLPGRSHYLLGNDPAAWIRGVPHHGSVVARGVLPGVDLRWRGLPAGRLAYDLLLAPGVDPATAVLRWDGVSRLSVDPGGNLLATTGGGTLRHAAPVAWQEDGARRRPVAAAFEVLGEDRVRFRLGRRDPTLATVIDPTLDYSTFLGGGFSGSGGLDIVADLAAGPSRTVHAVGQTTSMDFPVLAGYKATRSGSEDAFVTKFSASGSSLVYSTYFGGGGDEYAFGVAVAADGAATVCGFTNGSSFPTVNPFDGTFAGNRDGFVSRLSADGTTLVFSSFLGGVNDDIPFGVALAPDGGAVVCGTTVTPGFTMTGSTAQPTFGGGPKDAFVLRTSADGTTVAWSSYLGGSGQDEAEGIAVDAAGGILVTGLTYSTNFPLANAVQANYGGQGDAFVTRFAGDGGSHSWSTYFGGSSSDYPYDVCVDSQGRATVVGYTGSSDLTTAGAFQPSLASDPDGFVVRYAPAGTAIQMSTYFGGSGEDIPTAVAVDLDGAVAIAGITNSLNLPVQLPVQGSRSAQYDAFVAMFIPSQAAPVFSTYLGGNADDRAQAVTFDSSGRIVIAGFTNGAGNTFPLQNAFQGTYALAWDGFVSAFNRLPPPPQDVSALLVDLDAAELTWSDVGSTETGYRIERATDGVTFSTLTTKAADVLVHEDADLDPSTTYTYRIRSLSGSYGSEPSGEVSVTTPNAPVAIPAAPTLLTATVVSPRRVDLAWQDNSDNEGFFQLARAEGSGLYATIATPRLGQTARTDAGPLPGRTYSWKVRAINPVGPSADSNVATATMPSTLEATVVKGRLQDRDGFARDAVTLEGTLAFGEEAEADAYDPAAHDIAIFLGPLDGDALLFIPAGSEGWRERRGKRTWKSPPESGAKVKFTVVPATGAWTLVSSRLTLAGTPGEEVRVTVAVDTDEGHHEAPWSAATKGGTRKFPAPAE